MKRFHDNPDDPSRKQRLAALYEQFHQRLVHHFSGQYKDVLSQDDIHDAVVDALLKIVTIDVDPARGNLVILIFGLCRNRIRDRIRKKRALKRGGLSEDLLFDEAAETDFAIGQIKTDGSGSSSLQRSWSRWWAVLESVTADLLRRLPERQKLVLASMKAASPLPLEDRHDFRVWWSTPDSPKRLQAVLGEEVTPDRLHQLSDQDITRGLHEVRKFLRSLLSQN